MTSSVDSKDFLACEIISFSLSSMVVGFLPGFIVPAIIGVVGKETRHEWLILFSVSASVIFISVGFFIIAVRPEEKQFDRRKGRTKHRQQPPSSILLPQNDRLEPTPKVASEFFVTTWPLQAAANVSASSQKQNEDVRTVTGRHVSQIRTMMLTDDDKKT